MKAQKKRTTFPVMRVSADFRDDCMGYGCMTPLTPSVIKRCKPAVGVPVLPSLLDLPFMRGVVYRYSIEIVAVGEPPKFEDYIADYAYNYGSGMAKGHPRGRGKAYAQKMIKVDEAERTLRVKDRTYSDGAISHALDVLAAWDQADLDFAEAQEAYTAIKTHLQRKP